MAAGAPRHGSPRTGRGRPSGFPVALRRRTAGGDGASRSRSAGVGRGGGAKTGVSARWFLRAWSGPQAVSSVRRAQWPAGPSQEAGYVCQSVGVGVLEPTGGERGSDEDTGPGRVASPGLASRSERRTHGSHTFGLGKVGQTLGRIFQRRGGGKSQRAALARGEPERAGTRRRVLPGTPLFLGYPLAGVALDSAVLPPSRGGGKPARGTSGERETDPPV